jgi:acyl carrier protein
MTDRAHVRAIVRRALSDAGDVQPFTDSDSLVVSGRLSSLDIVNVLLALEERFGFTMDADEFDVIKFDSVDSIVALLGERVAA